MLRFLEVAWAFLTILWDSLGFLGVASGSLRLPGREERDLAHVTVPWGSMGDP